MLTEPGFEAPIVMAFLEAHNLKQPRLGPRWRRLETVPLAKLDELLHANEIMLFEFEDWAREHYGRDGWFDPYEDPAELVA